MVQDVMTNPRFVWRPNAPAGDSATTPRPFWRIDGLLRLFREQAKTAGTLRGWSASNSPRLSDRFSERLQRFVRLPHNWDGFGGEPVSASTARHAYDLCSDVLAVSGAEPTIAPAGDGSLLLKWDLANGSIVETYILGNDIEPTAVTRGDSTFELDTTSPAELVDFLAVEAGNRAVA